MLYRRRLCGETGMTAGRRGKVVADAGVGTGAAGMEWARSSRMQQ
jgi:precorrin-6B methylase 2